MAFMLPVAFAAGGAALGTAAISAGVIGGGMFLGMTAAGWGWVIGSLVGTVLMNSMQDTIGMEQSGPRLNDLSSAVSNIEGSAITIFFPKPSTNSYQTFLALSLISSDTLFGIKPFGDKDIIIK